jgi:hypothetical protein
VIFGIVDLSYSQQSQQIRSQPCRQNNPRSQRCATKVRLADVGRKFNHRDSLPLVSDKNMDPHGPVLWVHLRFVASNCPQFIHCICSCLFLCLSRIRTTICMPADCYNFRCRLTLHPIHKHRCMVTPSASGPSYGCQIFKRSCIQWVGVSQSLRNLEFSAFYQFYPSVLRVLGLLNSPKPSLKAD